MENLENELHDLAKTLAVEPRTFEQAMAILTRRFDDYKAGYLEREESEESSAGMALSDLKGWVNAEMQGHGSRDELAMKIKPFLAEQFGQNRMFITAAEVFGMLKALHSYEAEDSKGVGDLLGLHGFCLAKGRKEKFKDGKKTKMRVTYRIPDPTLFADWYSSDTLLVPKKYYTAAEFSLINKSIGLASTSKFLSK